MKKIALTQRLVENTSYIETREALDIRYPKLIRSAGFLPIVLPYEIDFKEYFSEVGIDGIVLSGGNDLSSISSDPLSRQRDAYEKKLIAYALENRIPLFGMCRGLQIIAEFFGSTFKQISGHVGIHHTLHVNPASRYAQHLSRLETVNSYHNFAVETLGADLIRSAASPDGTIKAIEHSTHKIFAQMWHTEREDPFQDAEIALLKHFFDEANR